MERRRATALGRRHQLGREPRPVGIDGWRLPNTIDDPATLGFKPPPSSSGFAHRYYVTLGNIGYPGGLIPAHVFESVFPYGLPAIATAAVLGILINAVFLIFKPSES